MNFFVRLTPKSSKTEIKGVFIAPNGDKYLKISVNSPPVDGKANEALILFLAKTLKTAKTRVRIIKGETDRNKTVCVDDDLENAVKELFKNDRKDN